MVLKIVFAVVIVVLIARMFKSQINRGQQILLLMQQLGFQSLGETLPADFPIAETSLAERIGVGLIGAGVRGRHEVVFFDCVFRGARIGVAQTVIAVRGGEECFPTVRADRTMKLESAGGWTMAYRHRKSLTAQEIQVLIMAVPA
ncbi:hypothetical protein [Granulicella arctica]|uniref:hypothetical protein n=1 Tax=Granulicella arctica TaxID=940613 RepID=UPI0021E0EDB9|nr:hypothetical protein [Granulicella arctica]